MASIAKRSLCRLCGSAPQTTPLRAGSADRFAHIQWRTQSTTATQAPATSSGSLLDAGPSTSIAASDAGSHPAPLSTDPKTRIVAATILSRPPRQMSPLTKFEKEYYKYARRVNRALGSSFNPEWFFRKGSQAEQAYKDLIEAAEQGKELQDYPSEEDIKEGPEEQDLHNMERKKSRTLYMLAQKKRSQHAWQFPQGGVEPTEALHTAALRELTEEFGSDLDVWQTGKVPAAHYAYDLPKTTAAGQTRSQVFFMPARVMRGTPVPNKSEGLVEYAWCTREEVHEKIQNEPFWAAIKNVLSH